MLKTRNIKTLLIAAALLTSTALLQATSFDECIQSLKDVYKNKEEYNAALSRPNVKKEEKDSAFRKLDESFCFAIMKIEREHPELKDKKDIKKLLPEVESSSATHKIWTQDINASNIEQYYNNTSKAVGLLGGLKDRALDNFTENAKKGIFPEEGSVFWTTRKKVAGVFLLSAVAITQGQTIFNWFKDLFGQKPTLKPTLKPILKLKVQPILKPKAEKKVTFADNL